MIGRVRIAILAKAPVAGYAKTRLIPALGARGAARLQRRFTRDTVRTALDAKLGDVALWCAPDAEHRFFRALARTTSLVCRRQPEGDLGDRMQQAVLGRGTGDRPQPVLIIGTDCPALQPHHLRSAAAALQDGADAVFIPAEDGGYVLIGLQRSQPGLFTAMQWSTPTVMAETRRRAATSGLRIHELPTLWDVDTPADLQRWQLALRPNPNSHPNSGDPNHA